MMNYKEWDWSVKNKNLIEYWDYGNYYVGYWIMWMDWDGNEVTGLD